MRAREFIVERQDLDGMQKKAIPGLSSVGVPGATIGPNNYYHKYRLGVHMAGSPENVHPYPVNGEFVDDMVLIGYTEADRDIIAHSINAFGYKTKKHSPEGSKESQGTNTVSPVSNWNTKGNK